MRVSVPIDSSDAKATSSGDTTRRDGFGTPHAGANTNVSNGPTDARSTNRRIMALALPTEGNVTGGVGGGTQIYLRCVSFYVSSKKNDGTSFTADISGMRRWPACQSAPPSSSRQSDYAYSWPTRPLRRWHICWERVVVARDCRQALMACGWP